MRTFFVCLSRLARPERACACATHPFRRSTHTYAPTNRRHTNTNTANDDDDDVGDDNNAPKARVLALRTPRYDLCNYSTTTHSLRALLQCRRVKITPHSPPAARQPRAASQFKDAREIETSCFFMSACALGCDDELACKNNGQFACVCVDVACSKMGRTHTHTHTPLIASGCVFVRGKTPRHQKNTRTHLWNTLQPATA